MVLDIPTFVIVGAFIILLCGALLIYAHFYYRAAPAALWWGTSHIILAAGVVTSLTGGMTGDDRITGAAFILFLMSAGAQWHGTRLLTGAKSYFWLVLPAPLLMAVENFLPLGSGLPMVRGMTAMVLNVAFFGGAIYTLLRPAAGRLGAYKPLAFLFAVNTLAIGLAPFGGLGTAAGGLPPLLSLVGLLHLEGQIFVVASTFFVIAALSERNESDQRHVAETDALTGLASRRRFFDDAARVADGGAAETLLGAVIFDLDHFKTINDRFGHPTGDQVLRLFAKVAGRILRPHDLLGRIGGEEFAAILSGSGPEATYVIAERIRRAFELAAEFVDGQPVHATLSAGVATAAKPAHVDALMRSADAALYTAKQKGRNRVERGSDGPPPSSTSVARVA